MELDKCGKNLKEALKRKGLTQKNFVEEIGTESVSFWVNGKEPVPKKYRKDVERILEIPVAHFMPTIGYVYLFYYSDLKSEGKSTWPCNIGRTAKSVCSRVKEQNDEWGYKGENKRKYEIALTLCVPFGQEPGWEKMIQGIFILRGKWLDKDTAESKGLKGNEWFDTSPDEVKEIYKSIKEFNDGYFHTTTSDCGIKS